MLPLVRNELSRCRPMLERALARQGLWTFDDIVSALEAERAQLWPGQASAMVTTIEDYPSGPRVIQAWQAAGHLGEIVDVLRPLVERQAKADWGCTHATIDGGRAGWARQMAPHGYAFHGVTLIKELAA